jgi:hypothetical protein
MPIRRLSAQAVAKIMKVYDQREASLRNHPGYNQLSTERIAARLIDKKETNENK